MVVLKNASRWLRAPSEPGMQHRSNSQAMKECMNTAEGATAIRSARALGKNPGGRAIQPSLSWVLRLCGLCVLLLNGVVSGHGQEYSVKTWTVENGLPQNIIRGITQTPDGYLWIATLNGVARFDGVRFVVFDKSNTRGIASNRFGGMAQGSQGDLWLPTEGGALTRYHAGSFRTYGPEDGIPANSVKGIAGDSAGNLWVLAEDAILKFDRATGSFIDATPAGPRVHYQPLRWDNAGFWGPYQSELHVFAAGRMLTYQLPPQLPSSSLWDTGFDSNGGLWIETFDGRQAFAAPGELSIKLVDADHPRTVSFVGAGGRSWTEHIDPHLGRYLDFTSSGQQVSIPLRCSFQDREGNLWVGTEGSGLSQLQQKLIRVYSQQQGLAGQDIYPVYQDKAGTIWMGAWPAGLSSLRDGKVTNYTPLNGLPGRLVTALGGDHEGTLWVGTHGGVATFRDGHFQRANLKLADETVAQAIFEDRGGSLWLGTANGLVVYRDGPSRTITVEDGLAGNDVKVILQGRNGDMWIGGYGGLTRIHEGQFTHWTERDGLRTNNIRALYEDEHGVLWIGSYDGGLARLKDGKFTHYDERDGLFNNGVFQILADGRGNLWMSSNRGIYSVSKRQLDDFADGKRTNITSTSYGRADGMLNVECNGGMSPAGVKANDGTLWFPTQDGVAVIDPRQVRVNPQPPPVMIEAAFIDRVPADIRQGLKIPPGKQNIELEYTALSFVHSEQIQFRYRLEGLDSDWVDAGSRRTAYYSHLPPGKYTFHVIAANSDGVWNNAGQILQLTVLTPFYRTAWFLLLEGVIAAMLITLATNYRLQQLKRQQAVQKAFSQQLIASQEKERQRIAAELHDSLGQRLIIINNLAQLYIKAQRKHVSDGVEAMEEISAEIALAIQETREISYNLRPFQLDRLGLTKAVEIVLRAVATSSGLKIVSEIENIDDALPDDLRINFYRIVQEAMNNIMKHAHATEVNVTVMRDNSRVILSIRDNGVGFTPASLQSKGGKSGFGLTGIEERAHSLGGNFRVRSVPGAGTTMIVEIPIYRA